MVLVLNHFENVRRRASGPTLPKGVFHTPKPPPPPQLNPGYAAALRQWRMTRETYKLGENGMHASNLESVCSETREPEWGKPQVQECVCIVRAKWKCPLSSQDLHYRGSALWLAAGRDYQTRCDASALSACQHARSCSCMLASTSMSTRTTHLSVRVRFTFNSAFY